MLANMAFRHAWLGRVKNRRLASTIARFVDHVQTVRLNTLSNAETRQVVMNGLERLYEALINRDEAAGARAYDRIHGRRGACLFLDPQSRARSLAAGRAD